jgi:hypothetical protein
MRVVLSFMFAFYVPLACSQHTFAQAIINGTVFNLPPASGPIEDVAVEIRAFRILTDQNQNLILDANPLAETVTTVDSSGKQTGRFLLKVPLGTGQQAIVSIRFNRQDQNVTQDLAGVVLYGGESYRYDVTVPREGSPLPRVNSGFSTRPPCGHPTNYGCRYQYIRRFHYCHRQSRRWF